MNFLATLGWNDGTTQEIFSEEELIEKFDISRINKSGASFDEQRLIWMNGHYIRSMNIEELYEKVKDYWPKSAENYDDEYKMKVLGLVQERLKFYSELPSLTNFFFEDLEIDESLIKDNKFLKNLSDQEINNLLQIVTKSLSASDFSLEDLSSRLNLLLSETNKKPGEIFSLIRIVSTWAPSSPPLAESLSVLGKQKTLDRISNYSI